MKDMEDWAFRQGKWKLLINADSTLAELHNLYTDPGEQNSLVVKRENLARELAAKVLEWRRTTPIDMQEMP